MRETRNRRRQVYWNTLNKISCRLLVWNWFYTWKTLAGSYTQVEGKDLRSRQKNDSSALLLCQDKPSTWQMLHIKLLINQHDQRTGVLCAGPNKRPLVPNVQFCLEKKRHSLHTELSNALQVCMFWLPMPLLQNINNSILIHHPCLKGVMEQGGWNLREIILFSALKSLKFHPHSSQDPRAPLCFFYFEPFMSAESARHYPQCSLPPGSSN